LKRLILWSALAALVACGPAPAPPPLPKSSRELVVAIRPGPTTFFVSPAGRPAGLDRDLAALFAGDRSLLLRVLAARDPTTQLAGEPGGDAVIAAGGLYRPSAAAQPSQGFLYSSGYYTVEPVLVYNTDGTKPASWDDLAGATVGMIEGASLDAAALREAHPEVVWEATSDSAQDLLKQVAEGGLGYAVVASSEAAVARNLFFNVATAFPAGPRRDLVWVLPLSQSRLRDEIDAFFDRIRKDGTLQRLVDRYFGYSQRVERIDAAIFQERIRGVLPAFTTFFHQAQQDTGIDWRLLAAVAYQESHWDPAATSATNVRGMMMLTEDTARRMRLDDRLDARQSILAGARYLQGLQRTLPGRIGEPDRTWLALAAFNIGIGHLEDARVLAQRRNLDPDSWSDIKKTLPLLAQPAIAADTKFGFARGGQAVVFVETVRAYYDVLLRLEEPYYGARLKASR
jgi:membrane-bound lytic murein transglycosylase F